VVCTFHRIFSPFHPEKNERSNEGRPRRNIDTERQVSNVNMFSLFQTNFSRIVQDLVSQVVLDIGSLYKASEAASQGLS
jgi:hypothetical protein